MTPRPNRKTDTAVMPISEAKGQLSEVVTRVRITGQRTVLTRHGKIVAAIVSPDDLAKLAAA